MKIRAVQGRIHAFFGALGCVSDRTYAVPLVCVTARRAKPAEAVSPTGWGMASPLRAARHDTKRRLSPVRLFNCVTSVIYNPFENRYDLVTEEYLKKSQDIMEDLLVAYPLGVGGQAP